MYFILFVFFFNVTATTDIYTDLHTLSRHDALPISRELRSRVSPALKALLRSSSTKVIQPSIEAFAQLAEVPALALALAHTTTLRLRRMASIRAVCRLAIISLELAARRLPLTSAWNPGTPATSTIAMTAIATSRSINVNPPVPPPTLP